jgi:FkbH-like protein
MLRQQVERESEREQMSREEFLMSLQSRIDFHELKNQSDKNYARVVELVNKTNQFNTTGYRWNHEEFVKHWSENGRIYYFSVRDRFSDYGVVGVIFTCEHQIKQMVMSCRVLGMEIENAAVVEIVKKIRSEYPKEIVGIIRFTEANMPSRAVFSKIGFLDNGDNYYKLGAIQEIQTPRHIACHFN